ncbi:hypothetical protein EDD18DRAFT_1335347 [Armillaria luteobubalina]|uniref:Uncharacterized protein n=1 Tax=Armillaria luteobubalina TaxID=153913 RepID=A0AA39UQ66_9AGAR|nr:hypothetical protein EDD18DRAFT_1335347 [Armillaria luteobubalina]
MATSSQRAPVIYASLILPKGHGYPLWIPEPRSNRPNGTQIGDLGIFNDDGGFTYLFNVCKGASDPVNENGVPPGFEPIKNIREPSLAAFGHVSGFEFTSSGLTAAVLVLPDGAERYDSEQRRRIHNGMLYLVTGYDKCHSWSSACYSDPIESKGASLKFLGGARHKRERRTYSGVYQRSHQRDFTPGTTANQTVFMHGFSISVRTILKSVSVLFIGETNSQLPPIGKEVPYSHSQLGIGPAVKRALGFHYPRHAPMRSRHGKLKASSRAPHRNEGVAILTEKSRRFIPALYKRKRKEGRLGFYWTFVGKHNTCAMLIGCMTIRERVETEGVSVLFTDKGIGNMSFNSK